MIPTQFGRHSRDLNLLTFCFITVLIVAFAGEQVMACGPHHCNHLLKRSDNTPLKLRQRVPNTREPKATGPRRGAVHRGSEKFKALVTNNNTLIEFYYDVRNDSDSRLMTKRCKNMLDRLADAVNQSWGQRGVKLKVLKAYDTHRCNGKGFHGSTSLHHEGRAVDLTTSDDDTRRLAELGRMAYRVGFDWVVYARRGFIHASVMSEESFNEQQEMCRLYKKCVDPATATHSSRRSPECRFGG